MKRALALKLLLCLFAFTLISSTSNAQDKGPIKLGFLAPMTGPRAETGKDMSDGFKMYLEEVGYKAGGREIQVVNEDDRATGDVAVTKFRKLVTHDHVAAVAGIVAAPTGLATAAAADQLETPFVVSCCAVDDITQRKAGKWATRTGWTGSQPMFPFGEYVYNKLGYKRVAVFAVDFQFGYDNVGGFQKTFEDAGGKIIQKIWAPELTNDFGPYLASIKRNADALFVVAVGAMPQKFFKQYREAGLKLPLIGGGTSSDEVFLPSLGDEILGYISPLHYTAALNTESNKKFQEKYQKRFGKIPSYYSEHSYVSAMWLVQAINDAKGNVESKEDFLRAIKKAKVSNPPRMDGVMTLDEYGNPIQNIHIRKVEKIENHPNDFIRKGPVKWNSVIDTIPKVSQFGKYDPKKFMSEPTFSHDYPPCKNCE
jgi:branched-chain amino acid transport system substrate-binding protein